MAIVNGIWDYDRSVVFGSKWFNRWQGPMLYLLNHRSFRIREWTRDKLMIYEDPKLLIARITPNSIHLTDDWRNNQRQGIFYSYGRNRNRIIIAGDAIWSKIHSFDINFANRFAPALNLGFDTLTAYSTVADGYVAHAGATWATVRSDATGTSSATNSTIHNLAIRGEKISGTFYISRSFTYHDTSSIGAGTITAVVMSVRGYQFNDLPEVSAQKGTQADSLGTSDYDNFSGNYYGKTSAWSTSAYNTITFDSTGISDIVKDGTTKICLRNYAKDYSNSEPTGYGTQGMYFADNTGDTSDPKLDITYTAGGGTTWTPKIIFID